MDIMKEFEEKLKNTGKKVVFVECLDHRVLEASCYLKEHDICLPILLGNPEEILSNAEKLGINLEGISIFDNTCEEKREEYAEKYHVICPAFSVKRLLKKMNNPLFYAAILVKIGWADCMAAGVIYSTADVILAAQQYIGIREDISVISSIGYQMIELDEEKCIGIADCAVCSNPTANELADIAITSAVSYQNVMSRPAKIALLSYSTLGSGEGESVDKVKEAVRIANEKAPQLMIEGEFQIDTALLPEIAARKIKVDSKVAGNADVLIFPSLDAGNIAVKCMQMFGKKHSFGPILQGFQRPVTDFSRAAKTTDVIGNVMLCMLQEEQ